MYLTNLNLPEDKFRTGDILMSRYIDKNASWKDRLLVNGIIKTTGARHNHDEALIRKPNGLFVGNANTPHYELTPFNQRVREARESIRVSALFRYEPFRKHSHLEWYEEFQHRCFAAIQMTALLNTPYDWQSLDRILLQHICFNLFMKKLDLKNKEHHVYCSESVVLQYRASGIELLQSIGKQPFPSPIHMERLWRLGQLIMIADYGLRDYLLG